MNIVPSGTRSLERIGESQEAINRTDSMKFGVIKVSNLPRKIWNGRFCEGAATIVKADMQILYLGSYSKEGKFLPNDAPWMERQQLSWYKELSYQAMNKGDSQTALQSYVDELKDMVKKPEIVWNYLRNPILDRLPVGRETFLLLFCTVDGFSGFASEYGKFPLDNGKLQSL